MGSPNYTYKFASNGSPKWYVPEEANISSNFKEDVRWIDKIRDPIWKSKVQAIHGSMKSDVDSMESILEAAILRKDKTALKKYELGCCYVTVETCNYVSRLKQIANNQARTL